MVLRVIQTAPGGSSDDTVKIWSILDGTNLWTLESHCHHRIILLDLSHGYLVSAVVASTAHASFRVLSPDDGTCRHVITTDAIRCFQHDKDKIIA
ncbi:8913_t:CDS:2, partial [Entrophospora sp. SA101]